MGQCADCFYGYVLNGLTCVPYSNSTNIQCAYGYYLNNSLCLNCSLANCRMCSSNTLCTLCAEGYYLQSGKCLACSKGCRVCYSAAYCSQASDGYYLQYNVDGSNKGKAVICNSPCLTCQYYADYCLTCIDGYNISGSGCASNSTFTVQIVLGPSNSNTAIFS
jgi:hypothetical protein